jgi:ABC-type molybdate transport system substrate-binding protein
MNKTQKTITSTLIALTSVGLAYAPMPGVNQSISIVSGSELQEPLEVLVQRFEQENPNISIELKIQGSQDIVNNYINDKNDFDPTILIPANGNFLDELAERWQSQYNELPFAETPTPVAETLLVAVIWPERAKVLFPNGQFQWQRLEDALVKGNWSALGGNANWGSFDFVTTDPTRSNSGQLTLSLWTEAEIGKNILTPNDFNSSQVSDLFRLVKQSVYQPARSTDILLQEFIARGPNDADIATVYESIALSRWDEANTTQGRPYQILYLDPTVKTVPTAAIVNRDVSRQQTQAARDFIAYITTPEQQKVFVEYGFRPISMGINLQSVPNSPWSQNIPGAQSDPKAQVQPSPERDTLEEVIRQWQRAQ